jgi:hypothetical protein
MTNGYLVQQENEVSTFFSSDVLGETLVSVWLHAKKLSEHSFLRFMPLKKVITRPTDKS